MLLHQENQILLLSVVRTQHLGDASLCEALKQDLVLIGMNILLQCSRRAAKEPLLDTLNPAIIVDLDHALELNAENYPMEPSFA